LGRIVKPVVVIVTQDSDGVGIWALVLQELFQAGLFISSAFLNSILYHLR